MLTPVQHVEHLLLEGLSHPNTQDAGIHERVLALHHLLRPHFDTPVNFVCDTCEGKTLIRCQGCTRPFPQPWFYGHKSGEYTPLARSAPLALTPSHPDTFLCVMCMAHGVRVTAGRPDRAHVYTHPMVKFTLGHDPNAPDDPRAGDGASEDARTQERRLAALEDGLASMGTRFERLEERLAALQRELEERAERYQRELEERLVARFSEILVRALAAACANV
ncbi:uncharacterized protein BXZ73DRAFT_108205 [Epithele typhae]|uniref:uncharacterized protein n=1 Tax=Epithele typhae TaxID=378194 RepID=UPI0020073377|nr:uncharacterized protein BXZ73DRAFT_108205 [Epithele typhae]KAH9911162.1 hypothetical protein BXZ73DRAFT_108205 [Epithele typhae]